MNKSLLMGFLLWPLVSSGGSFSGGIGSVDLPMDVDFAPIPSGAAALMANSKLMELNKISNFNHGLSISVDHDLYDINSDYRYIGHRLLPQGERKLDYQGDGVYQYSGQHQFYEYKTRKIRESTDATVEEVVFLRHLPMVVAVTVPHTFDNRLMKVKFFTNDSAGWAVPDPSHGYDALYAIGTSGKIKLKFNAKCYTMKGDPKAASGTPTNIPDPDSVKLKSCDVGNLFEYRSKLSASAAAGRVVNDNTDPENKLYFGSLPATGVGKEIKKQLVALERNSRTFFLEYFLSPYNSSQLLRDDFYGKRSAPGASPKNESYSVDFGLVFLGG